MAHNKFDFLTSVDGRKKLDGTRTGRRPLTNGTALSTRGRQPDRIALTISALRRESFEREPAGGGAGAEFRYAGTAVPNYSTK